MKKLLALVLALILGFVGTTPAMVANVTVSSEVADRSTSDKNLDWILAYKKNCRGWHGNVRKTKKGHPLARRILLAPLNLLIGTASADGMMSIEDQINMFYDMAENVSKTIPAVKEEQVAATKITDMKKLEEALKSGKIPKKVVKAIIDTFSVTDMRQITAAEQYDKLKSIEGVGEKRAAKIVELLTGKFPNPLDMTRRSNKITEREESIGFSLRAVDPDVLMREYEGDVLRLNELKRNLYKKGEVNMDVVAQGQAIFDELWAKVEKADSERIPFRAKEKECKTSRMSRSVGSDIFRINYESKKPTDEWVTVGHGIQETFAISPWFCGKTQKKGQKRLDQFQKMVEHRLGNAGLVMTMRDNSEIFYVGFAASASHQKAEKLVMAKAESMKKHEKAIWFALTFSEILGLTVNGAQIWKMRANLLRPIRCELKTESGRILTLNDLKLVPDIIVKRHIENARTVGIVDENGEIMQDGPVDVEKTMADGTIMYTGRDGKQKLGKLAQHGQLTGFGEKGKVDDCTSVIAEAARLEGKEIPDDLKPLIAGEGVWKFDKIGLSWDEFVQRVNAMTKDYPGLNKLYLIREGDDLEEDVKVRRLTRSLIQQWIHLPAQDIRNITLRSRKQLKKMKTLKGAIDFMAENGKGKDRSLVAQVFNVAPWLVLNPCIQKHLENRYHMKQTEAASCKLRTKGSYPYIQEDLVAVAQIWIFGADPNRQDLGVLKANEISVSDAPNGRKVLAIRFPANFQTAAVRINRSLKEIFASCPSTCMISFYDDILIRQDGDVDGDEMAIILNDIAIRATEEMYREFNPPVIVFAHGGKPPKTVLGTRGKLIETMYNDLWKAKKYDGVGKYANLATLCCHFASLAYAEGRMADVDMYLRQMSLASTGAILSIDQVKGNDVSEELIERLESISKQIAAEAQKEWRRSFPMLADKIKAPARPMPFTQQFVKGLEPEECMGESVALCDQISGFVIRETGEFKLETGKATWNAVEAKRALLCFPGYQTTSVRKAPLTGTVLNSLADNWFNDKNPADEATFNAIRAGKAVGQKDLLLLLWRNACALEFRMEGDNLAAKRDEYYRTVRDILYTQACATNWVGTDGHVYTNAEKKFSVVNAAVADALCLNKPNSISEDKLGSYAMFVLKVFAKEVLWSLERSNPDSSKFMVGVKTADELQADRIAEEIEELYSNEEGETIEPEEPEACDPDDGYIPPEDDEGGVWW